MSNKVILSSKRREDYIRNAEVVQFLRQNPIYACEVLLGIPLLDSQAWILQNSWHTAEVMWTCSRNWGKSFMIAVISMLKLILYPNIKIYILSSKGNQAQETFLKLENIAKQRINSIPSLKDIFINEVEKSSNSDGFIHDPASFKVTVFGGGTVFTLNSVPDNIRGKRADVLIFDESSFCDDKLIETALPYIAQDSNFKLSVDKDFDSRTEKTKIPNQVIYASSAGDATSKHAKLYKDYAKRMIMGDRRVFCADITVDIPLAPRYKGQPTKPLIDAKKVKSDMQSNYDKAMREYYNKFDADGGSSQIIKWANIRRNEKFDFPQMASENDNEHFAIAFDPAHLKDSSIISVMKIINDDKIGYYGEIVNCINLIDINNKSKMNLKFGEQEKMLKRIIENYSTKSKLDYEGIGQILIDAGAGGHGTSYADELLSPWTGEDGITRKGLIDRTHKRYKDETGYLENKDILRLVSPQSKNEMIANFITLMKSDLIRFPRDYNNGNSIAVEKISPEGKKAEIEYIPLSIEEIIALKNIDIMKTEVTSIHQYGNNYAIEKSKEGNVGDDRFDTLIMLSNYLYELRRKEQVNKGKKKYDLKDYFIF